MSPSGCAPPDLAGRPIDTGVSLGIVLLEPEDSVSAADVLARADLAMYKAKRAGKGRARVYGGAAGSRRAMIVPQRTPDSS